MLHIDAVNKCTEKSCVLSGLSAEQHQTQEMEEEKIGQHKVLEEEDRKKDAKITSPLLSF